MEDETQEGEGSRGGEILTANTSELLAARLRRFDALSLALSALYGGWEGVRESHGHQARVQHQCVLPGAVQTQCSPFAAARVADARKGDVEDAPIVGGAGCRRCAAHAADMEGPKTAREQQGSLQWW